MNYPFSKLPTRTRQYLSAWRISNKKGWQEMFTKKTLRDLSYNELYVVLEKATKEDLEKLQKLQKSIQP